MLTGATIVMKWLTAVFIVLLLALAAIPTAINVASGWIAHRRASVESIDYLSRDVHELSASRRRAPRKHNADPGVNDKGDSSPDDKSLDEPRL
jgi:hypothetical protein